jgi:hypothetical protein
MTNRKHLNGLSNSEYMDAIQKICKTVAFDYVDWMKWLDAEEGTQLEYIGRKGQIHDLVFGSKGLTPSEWEDCIVLEDTTMYGRPYTRVIKNGQYIVAPKERVRLCKDTN